MSWQGKRVFVTGAGGFIGSQLVEQLVRQGANVRALVRYNGRGDRGWLEHSDVRDDVEIVSGDISDYHFVHDAMTEVDVVFHLAALIAIPFSYKAPMLYQRVNVEGTGNVLQAARMLGTPRVVQTSTSEVYGTARYVPIDEEHPVQGQSPYSASKIGADKLAESYYRSFDLPVVVVRPFNTYGPRQSVRAVIPSLILQCLNGTDISLGHLHPTRDMNFVEDTVRGFLMAAQTDAAIGEVINLGSGQEISIGDLATKIAGKFGRELNITTDEQRLRPPKSEVERLLADASKARKLVGWQSEVSLDEGLDRTIAWLAENRQLYRGQNFVL
jgi:NAD dependent epimerase/dehydratase